MITPQPGPVWPRARRRQDRFARAFGGGRRGAPASLDRGCARRPSEPRSGRRNGASIEQRNRLLMPRPTNQPSSIGKRDSHHSQGSENMPRPHIGGRAMTPAERQARRRARLRRDNCASPAPPARRTPPRPQRWAAAVAALIDLQDQYRAWLDNLPASLEGRDWRISCRPSPGQARGPRSISRSCTPSTYHAATAATDRGALSPQPPNRLQQHKEVDNNRPAGAHCRRQDHGGESSCPVMSRSLDRRSSLERGSPETKPRSCGSQPAHESLFNRRLRVLSPAVRNSKPAPSANAEQIVASGPLKANMRAGCGKKSPPR
jgi:hypothetical protein